jgi:PilZ domain-containing protein
MTQRDPRHRLGFRGDRATGASASAADVPTVQPEIRQPVLLTLPGVDSFQARVTRVDHREIVLVLLLEARNPVKPGDVASMRIEFGGPRGLVKLEGEGVVEDHDVVRFHMAGAVDVEQRRDYVRVRAVRPMAIARVDEEGTVGRWIDTFTVDLSGNGLLASGPDTLEIDADVRFRVRLVEGEPPIEGAGTVARASDGGHRGIRITDLGEDARKRLVAFIFERERIARKLTRDGEL